MSEYQLAATELGLLHRRAERGLVDNVSFGWRRDRLLAGMKTATSGLLARPARRGHGRRTACHASGHRQPRLRPPPASQTGLRPGPSRIAWTHDGAGLGQ